MTPRPLEWIDTAPVRASRSRRMAAAPARVWDAIADHEGWPTWFPNLTEVVPGSTASGVGGTRTVRVGGAVEVEEEFLAWDPGSRFSFTVVASSRAGLRSLNEDVRITPDGPSACTVTYTMGLDVAGAAIVAPVLSRALGRAIGQGLAGLAAHVER